MLGGLRLWPAIFLGRLAAGWLSGSEQTFVAEIFIAIGNTLAVVVPLLLVRKRGGIDPTLPDLPHLLRYFWWGGAGGGIIAAGIGAATVTLSGGLPPERLANQLVHRLTQHLRNTFGDIAQLAIRARGPEPTMARLFIISRQFKQPDAVRVGWLGLELTGQPAADSPAREAWRFSIASGHSFRPTWPATGGELVPSWLRPYG